MKIISVVGARPNFIKISPFIKAIDLFNQSNDNKIEHILVHTGQHYDDNMSKVFFETLEIKDPDINLNIGSGSHAEQVGNSMIEFEKVLFKEKPMWVVVVGDVNAALACSVAAKKLNIKVCHIESGLRSQDMTMPEEINRIITDRISDLLLVPDKISIENLIKEGILKKKIKFVGNIMIDSLNKNKSRSILLSSEDIIKRNMLNEQGNKFFVKPYALITMHRPSNVDNERKFNSLIKYFINELSQKTLLLWPIHPRTKDRLIQSDMMSEVLSCERIILLEPLNYLEMLKLNMESSITLTDSGGVQEECCVLGVPCVTLRFNTERPVTLRENGGVSILTGNNIGNIRIAFDKLIGEKNFKIPDLWDGNTAQRCLEAIINYEK